jgi:hypothetical protein
LLEDHQRDIVKEALRLTAAEKRIQVAEKLALAEQKENELESQKLINKMNLQREEALRKLEIQTEVNRKKEAEDTAAAQAEKDLQILKDAIADAARDRKEKDIKQEIDYKNKLVEIEKIKQDSYAQTVANIIGSISPDLAAALTSKANTDMVSALEHAVAPYVLASDTESIADVVARITKGLPLEEALNKISNNKN